MTQDDDFPQLHRLAVGEPYIAGLTSFPEGIQYLYRGHGHHELLMWLHNPTPGEVRATRRGPVDLALHVDRSEPYPVILLLYQFSDSTKPRIRWSDASYAWHLMPEDQRALPEPSELEDPHYLLQALLVSANDGILRVFRIIGMTPAFGAALHLAIRDQAEAPWPGPEAWARQLARVERRTPRELAAEATMRMHSESWHKA